MPLDAKLFEVNADDGECGDLWQTGKGRPKMTGGHGLVFRIEIAVTDQPRQEFGLVAGGIKVQPGSLHDRVDDALAAVADERNRILAATFEREDQRGCRHGDDHAKHDRQGRADGNVARSPPRGSSIAAALLRSLTRRPCLGKDLPGQYTANPRTDDGHSAFSGTRRRTRQAAIREATAFQ